MEAIVAIAILIATIFVGFSATSSGRNGKPTRPRKTGPKPLVRPNTYSHGGSKTRPTPGQPPKFDTKHSEHYEHTSILTGTAWVTDGDTIKIKNIQIRLFGIDAPEMNHPYGNKAKWALYNLCKGHSVRAEITDEDDHGRAVAKCYLPDGRDLSAEMVKLGLAIDWPNFSGGQYRDFETSDARKKLFLADARQKGHMHIWEKFEAKQSKS